MKKIYISDQEIMNRWNYLLHYMDIPNDGFTICYHRTEHAFCEHLYKGKKPIGCVYVFGIKKDSEDGKIHGYVARVYVNKYYRHKGNGAIMMWNMLEHFGHCVLHISSASPNRIDDLTNENRERYRSKLYRFYEQFGFHRTSSNHTGMIRLPK